MILHKMWKSFPYTLDKSHGMWFNIKEPRNVDNGLSKAYGEFCLFIRTLINGKEVMTDEGL